MTYESYVPCTFVHRPDCYQHFSAGTSSWKRSRCDGTWTSYHQFQPTSSSSPGQQMLFYGSSPFILPTPQSVNSWGLGCDAHPQQGGKSYHQALGNTGAMVYFLHIFFQATRQQKQPGMKKLFQFQLIRTPSQGTLWNKG